MDADSVVKGFVQHYYTSFDTDRSKLFSLYREDSQLTFEGSTFIGAQAIAQKFTSLSFKASQHKIDSVDFQPSPQGGLFVFCTGQILPEGESYPLKFSQAFHLIKVNESFVLTNGNHLNPSLPSALDGLDLFRLNMA